MPLSYSPSSFAGGKKTIFQKLFGRVKGAIAALGILSTPALAQTNNTQNTEPKMPPIEERLATAQKMNLEGIKSIQELEETIERTWSQLKDTPKTPKEIRDTYGHITTKGLMWIESELPKEHLGLIQKYKDTQKKLAEMNKKDPKWGATEYGLLCLGGLLMALIGYKIGKIPKKDVEKLKKEYEEVLDIANKNGVKNALLASKNASLEAKIKELEKTRGKGWSADNAIDAEIVEPKGEGNIPESETASLEIPEWAKGTFLAEDGYTMMRNMLITDLSSDTPSQEVKDFQESISNLSNTAGTDHEKAGRLNTMSEKFIVYAESKRLPEHVIHTLLRHLVESFKGQELYFGSCPVIGQPFDTNQMLQEGKASLPMLKVSKILSLPVLGPNRHPNATTKNVTYAKAKVNCQ